MSDKKKQRPVRACLIVSARSGRDTFDLACALDVLSRHGWEVAVREKHEKGEAVHLARQAAEDGFDPIVNCGGDGTLNELVEGLTEADVAVGTIPGGTENVWARGVGISQRTDVAATQLLTGIRCRVDVGRVEVDSKHAAHFLMMAGLGADGAVMRRVSRPLKQRVGPLAVGVAAIEALPSVRTVHVEAMLDDITWDGEVAEIIVGNTRGYGGFTQVTGAAYIDDGLLDVCLFTTHGLLAAGRQLTSLLVRRQPSEQSAEQYRAAHITVTAPPSLPLQVDGSVVDLPSGDDQRHYAFSVIPRGLTVLVPRTYDGALFAHGIDAKKGRKRKGGKKGS